MLLGNFVHLFAYEKLLSADEIVKENLFFPLKMLSPLLVVNECNDESQTMLLNSYAS